MTREPVELTCMKWATLRRAHLQTRLHPLQDCLEGKCARPYQKEIVVASLEASDSVLQAIHLELVLTIRPAGMI